MTNEKIKRIFCSIDCEFQKNHDEWIEKEIYLCPNCGALICPCKGHTFCDSVCRDKFYEEVQ